MRAGLTATAVAAAAAVVGVVLAQGAERFDPVAILAPAAVLALVVLVLRPELFLLLVLSLTVLLEFGPGGPQALENVYYADLKFGLTVMDVLIFALVGATLLDCYRRRLRPVLAGPLSAAIVLLIASTAAGAATGYFAGGGLKGVWVQVVTLSHLFLLPLIVVNVARGRRTLQIALPLIALLAAEKALVGLGLVATGRGPRVDGHPATYLDPSANWINLLVLLGLIACALQRVRLPWWAWAVGPLAIAELVFSYRRSFWLGAIVGLVLVVVLASGARGRRVLIPVAAVVVALSWWGSAALGTGESTAASSPLVQRLESLRPNSLEENAQDRYRIDERRNVIFNLKREPIAGLGLGQPWTAPYPLSVTHPGDRTYSHVVLLWYWLNLGLLGAIAYVTLVVSAIATALLVWRRHAAPVVRGGALGLAATMAASVVIETTGSFTGVEARFSVLLGAVLGLLAVAYSDAGAPRRSASRPRSSPMSTALHPSSSSG